MIKKINRNFTISRATMAAGHSWSIVLHFFVHVIVFVPIRAAASLWNQVAQIFFPSSTQKQNLVQVRRVLWQHNLRRKIGSPMSNALHVHARWEDAHQFAWKDPYTHLQNLSLEGATFVRTTKGINVYDSQVNSFAFSGVFANAEEFAVIPLDVFARIAEEEWAKVEGRASATKRVVFVGGHSRSGGSLLVRQFEDLRGSLILNEPQVFINAFNMILADESRKPLLKRVVAFATKYLYVSDEKISTVVIKIPNKVGFLFKDVMDIPATEIPFDVRFLFGYRNPIPCVKSLLRLATEVATDALGFASHIPLIGPILWPDNYIADLGSTGAPTMIAGLKRLVGDEDAWQRRFSWLEALDLKTNDKDLTTSGRGGVPAHVGRTSLTAHFFCFYMVGVLTLRELMRKRVYASRLLTSRYEDLLATPEKWTQTILPFCGYADEAAALAAATAAASTALDRDSQKLSRFNRQRMATHGTTLTAEDTRKLDVVVADAQLATSMAELEHPF